MKRLYKWLTSHVHTWYAPWLFGLAAFIEGFFFVPIATLLTFFCLENRQKSFFYATVVTLVSAAAAIVGYSLGALIWYTVGESFIYYIIKKETFDYLVLQYKTYQAATILFVSLLPIPFKALTLTAGFCRLPIVPFVIFCMIGRGVKFFAIATGIYLWGHRLQYYIDNYFYYLLGFFATLMALFWYFIH